VSLKTFHIFFVIVSIFLSFGVGAWGLTQYREFQTITELVLGIIGVFSGFVLIFYFKSVLKKYKDVGFL